MKNPSVPFKVVWELDADNRITQMDGGSATYAYDGEGYGMKKKGNGETTYYFYGPGGLLCEFTTTNTGATTAGSSDRATYRTSDKLGSAVLTVVARERLSVIPLFEGKRRDFSHVT